MEKYVIPPYRHKRDFYHSQKYFHIAREALLRQLIEDKVSSVLDVGCGHGLGSKEIMKAGIKYVGVDPIEDNIIQARKDNPRGDFRVGYMQELPFKEDSFDAVMDVTVWDILPTVADMKKGLEECLRVSKRFYYSLNATAKPRCMTERYMMIPMNYGLTIKRVNYNPEKDKADYIWRIDKWGIN